MRISLITETYFPQVNGVSRTLGELVRYLTEQGFQVQAKGDGDDDASGFLACGALVWALTPCRGPWARQRKCHWLPMQGGCFHSKRTGGARPCPSPRSPGVRIGKRIPRGIGRSKCFRIQACRIE